MLAAGGTLLDINRAGLAMLDADHIEQLRGKCVYNLIGEAHRDAFRAFNERVCRGEKGVLQFEVVGLRGTRRWMETHAAALPGPHGRFEPLSITHDVTERKRAEAALREHGERMRLLWEAASVLPTSDEPEAMMQRLFARVGASLDLDVYFNYMVTEAGDGLRLVSSGGIPKDRARSIFRLEFWQAVCGTVALHRKSIVATHILGMKWRRRMMVWRPWRKYMRFSPTWRCWISG